MGGLGEKDQRKHGAFCAAHPGIPSLSFVNMKHCHSLAPTRLSDPRLPERGRKKEGGGEGGRGGGKEGDGNKVKVKVKGR